MNTLKEIVWDAANALFRLKLFTHKPQLPSLNPACINYYCVVFPLVTFYFPHFLHLWNGILWKSSFSCICFLNISIRMDLGMFIYLTGYNVILPLFIHLLAQVVLTLTTGNSFRLAPLSFQHRPLFLKMTCWHYKMVQVHLIFFQALELLLKEIQFLLLKMVLSNQDRGTVGAHCY